MSPVQSGRVCVLFNGFPFCTEEGTGDVSSQSIMSMDTIHQSAAPPLNKSQCGVKRLTTTCTSVKVVWSGISRLWLAVLDPSSWHHDKSDLKQVFFSFPPGNAVIRSLRSDFHFLANLPFTQRHL